jgi:hypothetical protein
MKPGDYEGEELLYRCLITITFTKILLEPHPYPKEILLKEH